MTYLLSFGRSGSNKFLITSATTSFSDAVAVTSAMVCKALALTKAELSLHLENMTPNKNLCEENSPLLLGLLVDS